MTSSHLKMEVEPGSDMEILSYLLMVGGQRLDPSSKAKLRRMAVENLAQIQQKALGVREMAMEGILSANVEVILAPTSKGYNPLYMQDAYNSQHLPQDDMVICQTGLGLRYYRVAPKSRNSTATRSEQAVLLKAKVLLSSALSPRPM